MKEWRNTVYKCPQLPATKASTWPSFSHCIQPLGLDACNTEHEVLIHLELSILGTCIHIKLHESILWVSRLHLVWEQREPLWYNSRFPQLLLTPDLAQGQNVQPCACEAFLPAFKVRMGVASALPSRRGQGCPHWGYLTVDWQAAKRPMDQRQGGVQQGVGSHVWSGKGLVLPRWSKACAALLSLWSMCEL